MSKFFDRSLLDAITWEQGIPSYVPGGNDNGAFTLDDHIYFGTGAFNPVNGLSLKEIVLIGHEVTHSRQYRQNGSLGLIGKYGFEGAKRGVAGTMIGGVKLGWELTYYGNKFETEAEDMGTKISDDILKNGNPCP